MSNGATLQSTCPGGHGGLLWEGITILGNSNQGAILNSHGNLYMTTNATIKDARCALLVGTTSLNGGGYISATNARFINNKKVARYSNYEYFNGAHFVNCEFLVNDTACFRVDNNNTQIELMSEA